MVRTFPHPTGDDRHQLSLGAVLDHAETDVFITLVQADDGAFAARATAPFAPHPARPKVTLINLHLAPQRRAFLHRPGDHPLAQQLAQPMHRAVIQPAEFRRRQHRQIVRKIPQHLQEFPLRNARAFEIFVVHCR